MEQQIIGRVVAINRYIVKSMRGEALTAARIGWHGLEGDRRYAFVRGAFAGRFPWLTGRELPALLQYRPAFADPAAPITSPVLVATPAGDMLPITSAQLCDELAAQADEPLQLLHLGRGAYDSSALSLFSTATLASLSVAADQDLDIARFRANIVVEAASAAPFPEDSWPGRLLSFGDRFDSARLRVVRPIQRCAMITIDPHSNARDPSVLRAVTQAHAANAGVYAFVETIGTIAVGDQIVAVG